jgi:aminodeoxyfutalosine synthase
LREIAEAVRAGERIGERDALALYRTHDIHALGNLASSVAASVNGMRAFYVRNLHVNPTNICVNRCRFCAFSRSAGEDGAYELTVGDIMAKIRDAGRLSEVHIVGGLHPAWSLEYYCEMLRAIKGEFPGLHVKAFTAVEIDHLAAMSGKGLDDVLASLRGAGLDAMPGGGAEVFSPRVREALCPEKIAGERWLHIMERAHAAGLRTNATMLYGHVESLEERVDHLMRLRDLQDRTGGFQAFIPLAYHPANTEMGGVGTSGLDDLRTVAVSRIVLDNFPHIKAYWVMLGEKVSQLALLFGADDLDGTVIEERITRAAGGKRAGIASAELDNLIRRAGREPVERDAFYQEVAPA